MNSKGFESQMRIVITVTAFLSWVRMEGMGKAEKESRVQLSGKNEGNGDEEKG